MGPSQKKVSQPQNRKYHLDRFKDHKDYLDQDKITKNPYTIFQVSKWELILVHHETLSLCKTRKKEVEDLEVR
jgi:aminopeptidase-like protein